MIFRRTENNVVEIHDDGTFWTVVPTHYKHIGKFIIVKEDRNTGNVETLIKDRNQVKTLFDYDVVELMYNG